MLFTQAIIEHSVIIFLCSISIVVLAVALRRKPPRRVWKECPILCCLLLDTLIYASANILISVEWVLVVIDVIPNQPEYTGILHFSRVAVFIAAWFYDSASAGVLAQRICYLVFPWKPARTYSFKIVVISFVLPSICVSVSTALNLFTAPLHSVPFPSGCMSLNCMTSHTQLIHLLGTTIKMFFSVVICSLGIAFNVLLARHQTVFNTGSNQKLNSFTRHVSFLRILLEFLPFTADIVLSGFGIRLSLLIGPFGAMASSTDFCVSSLLYYNFVTKTAKQVVSENPS
ncbi:hypothetical protein L596_019745 [Steinernema carpocapsae]|uniref:G-protein coupled receptors family 1 profile domain-containing protein n=1 Tax=Steinernema carpocapsae TaxID=34508 RepID=A0A4U5MRJ0_STECR|nr:hypothetical protein L596_019745 [Steinernema carpocapsae]